MTGVQTCALPIYFDLKNSGVGLGKVSPKVPAAFMAKVNALKAKIIAGTVKVPTALS